MKPKYIALLVAVLLVSLTIFLLSRPEQEIALLPLKDMSPALKDGRRLSLKYCGSCHLYTEPDLLDKKSWAQVLPVMKAEMGKSGIHLNSFEWLAIEEYYAQASPLALPRPETEELQQATTTFSAPNSLVEATATSPTATLVKYDALNDLLLTGDAAGQLRLFKGGKMVRTLQINNIPVDAQVNPKSGTLLVLGLGNLLPSEEMKGSLLEIDTSGNQRILVDSLIRPVHFLSHDFNEDGKSDYLISSFGSTVGQVNSGKLSLFYTDGEVFREKVVKSLPGAVKSVLVDFNADGRLDIVALFAQGRESISLFLNKGGMVFEERLLLEFQPVYGSNSFDLVDMNGDSFLDIVFTNGDNYDYSMVYKSYHGVRVFLNNGQNGFREAYFFHINGASKVIAQDFDGDGDPDMAVLSMFPDFEERAHEMLVYLENDGDADFKPSFLEKEPSGGWMVMDAGDINQDGRPDLIVGANYMMRLPIPAHDGQRWAASKNTFMVFSNIAPPPQARWWEKFGLFLGFE